MKYLNRKVFITLLSIFSYSYINAQQGQNIIKSKIDSLLGAETTKPFNGVVLVSQNRKNLYLKAKGYSNLEHKTLLKADDQFISGSIAKQFTSVLVLQAYEKNLLALDVPIRKYLPELSQSWKDTITIRLLLNHTSGIEALDKPTLFAPGTQFDYSHSTITYDLLAKILEKLYHKSFAEITAALFQKCGMKDTYHPDIKKYMKLTTPYTENENGKLNIETNSFMYSYAPAGGTFITTAIDLGKWNQLYFEGKLLKKNTMEQLFTKQKNSVRNHPVFGLTEYGLGVTIDTSDNLLMVGQTGFVPGYVTENYYFPKNHVGVTVLSNVDYNSGGFKGSFRYHTAILNIVRKYLQYKK
ncbi:serine hydrolase domain-containing protein [Elizabethkingia anophelis]|uniref:serine hydrolase domain-containing protein n=1 Tax=Elizabethkingia anophelis TaxID=1117645 RepID=UPI000B354F93|nr:serine hydrolase domain-containing protein [Elizabethkingia anophelis]MCT4122128.1 beta-lactamase family protein [Elizabethkingia anophelis]MCT4325015.1 beta-lactamase family protein [Elizabethkingia anophelis]MYY41246.1 class A beta-lactamase-related serine hydrolase [Elizabethkingia anophelis]